MTWNTLTTWPNWYVTSWASFCLLALAYWIPNRDDFEWAWGGYWRFLLAPWRLAFFAVAFVGINVMAPYTGDPTWDYVDASFMAILAYTTAPATLAIGYGVARGSRPAGHLLVAVALWLFSASWSYDGYLYLRDGTYPSTWSANLFASSFLYLAAGGFWALDWRPESGTHWAFTDLEKWPPRPIAGAGCGLPADTSSDALHEYFWYESEHVETWQELIGALAQYEYACILEQVISGAKAIGLSVADDVEMYIAEHDERDKITVAGALERLRSAAREWGVDESDAALFYATDERRRWFASLGRP